MRGMQEGCGGPAGGVEGGGGVLGGLQAGCRRGEGKRDTGGMQEGREVARGFRVHAGGS